MGRSRMSVVKRQRELKKSEKAAHKRVKKHGTPEQREFTEPQPTVRLSDYINPETPTEESDETQSGTE